MINKRFLRALTFCGAALFISGAWAPETFAEEIKIYYAEEGGEVYEEEKIEVWVNAESGEEDLENSEEQSGSDKEENAQDLRSMGQRVADFAVQFVGNPYRYGGTSLTNGADCSGFIMSVYANFGVSLPHSSRALRGVGAGVGNNLANALPGDIICYSGHAAIYIGGGRIVHASTEETGIKISNAAYRPILAIRRIF